VYVPRGIEATVTVQQRLAGSWYATAGLRHLDQRITPDTIGVLRTRTVVGSAGGVVTELSAGLLTDTRDNLFAPHAGRLVQLSYARSDDAVWSDFTFGTARLDVRQYRTVRREHVLATQLQVTGVDGTAPFDQLALIGNSDIMRGYKRGRYRDRWTAALQGEYRTPLRRRLGAVLFAGAGMAAPSLSGFADSRLLPSYGAGLRVQIDQRQRTGVRADYGRGTGGASGLYIGFNQAF
jgi:outer membrane protein assembly factor BamA